MEDQNSASYNYTLIIPHYNIPKLLRRCLRTVPKRDDLQVVVVDDCSTNELEELEKVKQEYDWVEWYDTGTNGGGGKARNIGLQHAKGKYLIFADADDYFNLCFCDALDKYKDKDSDIIYFAVNSVDSKTYQNSYRVGNYNRDIDNYILSGNELNVRYRRDAPWSKFIKRDIIINNNITYEESVISNDVRFSTLTDYHACTTYPDNLAIYCITTRDNSTSVSKSREALLTSLRIDLEHWDFLKRHNLPIKSPPNYFLNNLLKLKLQNDSDGLYSGYKLCERFGLKTHYIKFVMFVYPILLKIKSLF